MENTVSIITAKAITEESHDCILTTIPGKKIMFEGKKKNGETIALCTLYSKFNINNRYWVDITEVQLNTLDNYDHAILFIRLEGNHMLLLGWPELRSYLTPDCMKYNPNEGNHWKLYIHSHYTEIAGSDYRIEKSIVKYVGENV